VCEEIPILLPVRFSNIRECELRKNVSETTGSTLDQWQAVYDKHHFRKLAHKRLRSILSFFKHLEKPRVLDIGIGWGTNYLPFLRQIDLIGLDYSFESLLLLKRIYSAGTSKPPLLVCGSLSALPLKNVAFDVVWSTQVFQHIPDNSEILSSFETTIQQLLKKDGIFVVDNLNYSYIKPLLFLKRLVRPSVHQTRERANFNGHYYLKYYLAEDFHEIMKRFDGQVRYEIVFTENLFHPELGLIPRSLFMARVDNAIQKTKLAKYLGRQITLIVYKTPMAN
jgi:ubiquinone/menaquinone biosynthesis C-methylase UbiE